MIAAITSPLADVVAAVNGQRLARHAQAILEDPNRREDHPLATAALNTCGSIAGQLRVEGQELVERLTALGHDVALSAVGPTQQHHTLALRVSDAAAAHAAGAALHADFDRWDHWTGGAAASFDRTADHLTLVRSRGFSLVVRIEWRRTADRSPAQRVFRPTAGDWHFVDLPAWAWWLYPALRPIRLLAERCGLRRRHDASLGPFLSTPDSLIDALLDVAAVTADDIVADLGCGDGRLVVEAARRRSCRAVGVEHAPELAARAAQRARDAGVEDLVTIVVGDARSAALQGATVVLLFLPVDVAADLIGDTLARLPVGGRLVVHEQRELLAHLDEGVPTPVSSVLLGADAVTVAHRWTVEPPAAP